MSGMFVMLRTMMPIIFAVVLFVIVYQIMKSVMQKKEDDASPRLTVQAVVRDKTSEVHHDRQPAAGDITGAHGYTDTTHTVYRVTFQVESGDTMTFTVSREEYGALYAGDAGWLRFQGKRFLGFDQQNQWKEQMPRT